MTSMTIDYSIIETFKPFLLGYCNCGCGCNLKNLENNQGKIIKYIQYHNIQELRYYGSDHHNFNGYKKRGGHNNEYWKVFFPTYPNCDKSGYIYEHRVIMEQHLGRYLSKKEVVHHINGIKDDNRIENLELIENNSKHVSLYNRKNMSGRICSKCQTDKTYYSEKKKHFLWFKYKDEFLCRKCYRKLKYKS